MVEREPTLLYCRCAYAQVVPQGVKDEVLRCLCDSGETFEMVADLCEMAAHRDPRLQQMSAAAGNGGLRVAACFPRAVRGLFHQAGCALPESGVEIVNMRVLNGEAAADQMLVRTATTNIESRVEHDHS
ncbi:MAG: hypothetical protein ACR2OZ_12985 [Verrucomicrobiales bacterium]